MTELHLNETVLVHARHLAWVLEHAQNIGLPFPAAFSASGTHDRPVLSMGSLEHLREWARWLEVPIADELNGCYFVDGDALDRPITLIYTEPVSAA